MVDIVPNSQEIVGHGSFSIVYKARLEAVRVLLFTIFETREMHDQFVFGK